jgi:hypothetical protein
MTRVADILGVGLIAFLSSGVAPDETFTMEYFVNSTDTDRDVLIPFQIESQASGSKAGLFA